jgi:hypothetical protein
VEKRKRGVFSMGGRFERAVRHFALEARDTSMRGRNLTLHLNAMITSKTLEMMESF